jgi:uncharacterized membrane protein
MIRQFAARPRLALSVVLGLSCGVLLPPSAVPQAATRALIGWNMGAVLYLILAAVMMVRASSETIRRRAQVQDDGALAVLALVVLAVAASTVAIFAQLAVSKDLHGIAKLAHIGLAALTIVTCWALTHTSFALHYAHDYFGSPGEQCIPGLQFPGAGEPDYLDFLYFACVIGTSGQTADVSIVTSAMRRLALVHCVLAFFFNATVLALTINIAASLT